MDKQEQVEEWSRLYGRQITEEKYREICDNLKAYFELLIEADKAEKNRKIEHQRFRNLKLPSFQYPR